MAMQPILPVTVPVKKIKGTTHQQRCEQTFKDPSGKEIVFTFAFGQCKRTLKWRLLASSTCTYLSVKLSTPTITCGRRIACTSELGGSSHTSNLLNYWDCVNWLSSNGLYCTKQAHSHLSAFTLVIGPTIAITVQEMVPAIVHAFAMVE